MKLYEHQLEGLSKCHNGCILNGGVGSGKSITSLSYYYILNGGKKEYLTGGRYSKMTKNTDLYIITTAAKRDKLEWDDELINFKLIRSDIDTSGLQKIKVVIDSWNNIQKYSHVKNAFFIFDENKVIGSGTWVKTFLDIVKYNQWIILSATPGDNWLAYAPVFVANGYYKSISDFKFNHCIFRWNGKFNQLQKYYNVRKLERLRENVLVDMSFKRTTVRHHDYIYCAYDNDSYKYVMKNRWNIFKNEPIQQASELCSVLRKICNTSEDKQYVLKNIFLQYEKIIVFYNFDYERDILLSLDYGDDVEIAEWSGHGHMPLPTSNKWVYLVQYTAGCEGWNTTTTNCIVFFSDNYAHWVKEQAMGRIDRLNTKFIDLYYYTLSTRSPIDKSIRNSVINKKKFNEGKFANKFLVNND